MTTDTTDSDATEEHSSTTTGLEDGAEYGAEDGPADGWTYEGITSYRCATDPLQIDTVHAIQKQEVSGGGDYLHRRVTLRGENRVGPAEGGSPDLRELETDRMFDGVGVVTSYRDAPLTETAGVVMAEIGFGVSDPLWYWIPIEHEADPATEAPTGSADEEGADR